MADPRIDRLYELYKQLDELVSADELLDYPFLDHLGDLIADLELEAE